MEPKNKLNFAVIGTSWITESFVQAAQYSGLWNLSAVYSRTAEKGKAFAERFSVSTVYTDLRSLEEDKTVDAVYIASPNAFHYEQSKKMLLAGKNVLCEKPATVTREEFEELCMIADEKGLIYMEAIMSMYVPCLPEIHREIKKCGTISTVHFDYSQLSSKYPAYCRGENPNIFNPAMCTGGLMDLGVYPIYLAAAFFGQPTEICSCVHFMKSGADDFGSVLLKYPDFPVLINYSKIGQGFSRSEIIGDKQTVSIGSVSQLLGVSTHIKNGNTAVLVPDSENRTEIMSHEASFFHHMITDAASGIREYTENRRIAETVRMITDTIRQQNHFLF